MDDREQVALLADVTHVAARRLVGAAADAQRRRVRRVRGRRGLGQVDADRAARRRTCASAGARVTVTHEPGATAVGRRDPRPGAAPPRAAVAARRGAAVRRRPRPPRRHRHPSGARGAARSCSPTATSTRRWPTRASAATSPSTRCAGSRGGPPAACGRISPCCWTFPPRDGLARAGASAASADKLEPSRCVPRAGARRVPVLAEAEPRRYLVLDARTCRPPIRSPSRCRQAVERAGHGASTGVDGAAPTVASRRDAPSAAMTRVGRPGRAGRRGRGARSAAAAAADDDRRRTGRRRPAR